jgi:two-component system sensor histidine kinase SenX3
VEKVRDPSESQLVAMSRLAVGCDGIDLAIVVVDEFCGVVFRNTAATRLEQAVPHGPIVSTRLKAALRVAVEGGSVTENVDLHDVGRRTLCIAARSLEEEGRLIGAMATVEDVSERRRLDAVRRDFVANVSHELKTPVGAIGLLAEALEGEEDREVVARLVQRIQTESGRIGRMIDDLLDLSRIEEQGDVTDDRVPLTLVVSQAVERVQELALRRGISLDSEAVSRGTVVPGDPQQLTTAVRNLLDNAIKYSDPGSVVTVESAIADGTVEISVQDRGLGIPSRDLSRIFERFYRVDRARARDTGGTGLGLAIVRHVAENHGGSVRVESIEGEGSRFILAIPSLPAGA